MQASLSMRVQSEGMKVAHAGCIRVALSLICETFLRHELASQIAPGSRPPAVPKLGLNVALSSSSIPVGEPASLASYAFPSDVESAHPSTDIIHRP